VNKHTVLSFPELAEVAPWQFKLRLFGEKEERESRWYDKASEA